MEEPKQTNHALTVVIIALTVVMFVLDLLTPLGIAIWPLYILPLGLTRWSSLGPLTFVLPGPVRRSSFWAIFSLLPAPHRMSPSSTVYWVYSWCGSPRFS